MNYKKLDRLLENIIATEPDSSLLNIDIKPDVGDKLFDFQYVHVFNMVCALRRQKVVLDGSDTGTGKTYTAVAVCKQLRLRPFIVCPKTIMSTWYSVCRYFKVRPLAVVNYETVKRGKQYVRGERVDSRYIHTIKDDEENITSYKWTLPRYSIIIFDEAHRCKNKKSQNATLLMSTKYSRSKVMLLSATISDTPKSFHVFGYMLGLYKHLKQAKGWISGMLREDDMLIGKELSSINRRIYPERGSRIRIADIRDKFPDNQITAECYDADEYIEEINQNYDTVSIYRVVSGSEALKRIQLARQKIELIKVNIINDLINEYIDNGYNVAVFVNFKKTLRMLEKKHKGCSVVEGKQKERVRIKNIDRFQNNETKLIILMSKAGGEGISLHDMHGVPRVSIISPSFSSTELIQVLGRIHRAGSKTPALQRIVYCANTVEENICARVKSKLSFLSKLNDNDMVSID